jgi:hypothetical protein
VHSIINFASRCSYFGNLGLIFTEGSGEGEGVNKDVSRSHKESVQSGSSYQEERLSQKFSMIVMVKRVVGVECVHFACNTEE